MEKSVNRLLKGFLIFGNDGYNINDICRVDRLASWLMPCTFLRDCISESFFWDLKKWSHSIPSFFQVSTKGWRACMMHDLFFVHDPCFPCFSCAHLLFSFPQVLRSCTPSPILASGASSLLGLRLWHVLKLSKQVKHAGRRCMKMLEDGRRGMYWIE